MEQSQSRHILLVCKAHNLRAAVLGREMAAWLEERGHRATCLEAGVDSPAYELPDLDFAVVLGGDGTMLGVARRVARRRLPLLGINFGRVGYLADVQPENWRQGLAECLDGRAPIREHMALHWELRRKGEVISEGSAINDVVLSRAAMARLVSMDICVDKRHMCTLRSDGVLIFTPLGSSGYSVSAGGPLLHPSLEALVFTPICPFLNTIPPMVFPCERHFRMKLLPGTTESYLTVDGQEGEMLEVGDLLDVTGDVGAIRFLGNGTPFFERLRTRGFVTPVGTGGKM